MDKAFVVFVTAFSTVFAAMAVLTGMVYALRAIGRVTTRNQALAAEAAGQVEDSELIAVLAAAAHAVVGRPVTIHRVHVHRERATELWSRAGRMDIMISHRVERKR